MKPGLRTGVVEKLNQRVGMFDLLPLFFSIANVQLYILHSHCPLLESKHEARSIQSNIAE